MLGGPTANFCHRVVRLNAAGAAIVGILEAHESRASVVIVFRMNSIHELLDLQHSMIAFDRLRGDAEELGVCALLVAKDVAVRFAEKIVTGLAVDAHAELVTHRARRNEERGFFAEHCGDLFFELSHGGVVAKNVVAHVGGGHGGAHRGRGTRDGVAAEVDRQFHFGFSFVLFVARMDDA